MTKQEFLGQLSRRLPPKEREERLAFYSEMIDDRMEEGMTEAEAVASIDPIEIPEEKIAPRRLSAGEITLLALGSPLWLPLMIAALAVIWALSISLWAVFGALAACALGFTVGGILLTVFGHGLLGLALIGAGLVCAGVGIGLFYGCHWATRGILWLAQKLTQGIKNLFCKEAAQ